MSFNTRATATFITTLLAAGIVGTAVAQTPPAGPPPGGGHENVPHRDGLLWKEEWRNEGGGQQPLSLTGSVSNPDLELQLYGSGPMLDTLGKAGDPFNPPHIFTGESTKGPIAFAFRNKKVYADLSGLARISVSTKASGLHKVYPVVKLASGDWYVAERSADTSIKDWVTTEIPFSDTRWYKLDIANVVTKGNPLDTIDLSKVDAIGFADLLPASGHGPGGWVDVGAIEVYGKAVPR